MNIIKPIADNLLAGLVWLLLQLFRAMPFDVASNAGAWIARAIGVRLALSRKADRNLQYIWPDMAAERRQEIIAGMWDNLGRNFAEYNALDRMDWHKRVTAVGQEHEQAAIARGKPVLYLSMHLANWEVIPHYWARQNNSVTIVYRRANNRAVDRIIQSIRARTGQNFAAKGKEASKALIATMTAGGNVALLMDQRMSDGESLDFLGKPAMTGAGWARLVLKFDATILPIMCVRDGAGFAVHFQKPWAVSEMNLPKDDHAAAKILAARANDVYSQAITKWPEQWLWLHRRWGKV